MKKRLFYVLLLTISLLQAQQKQDSIKVNELEEVVISDSRFKLKRENSGKTIIKITAEELERNQAKTIAEIINSKSGIEISGSRSNAGQPLSYFVRGGNNRQVLVLIDGIQVSDPSRITNDYDLRLIDVNQIESIEIIKGASSTLYGNSAATAVINITSKKVNKKPISAVFSTAIGSNQSENEDKYNIANFTNAVSVNGTVKKVNYLVSFLHQFNDGLSATINDSEKDAFNRINVNTTIGYSISEKLNVKLYANHTKLKFDFDDAFFSGNAITNTEQNRIGTSLKYKYNDKGNFTINASHNSIFRDVLSSFPNTFEGKSYVIDAFNKYKVNANIYTVIGVNYIENQTNFDQEQDSNVIDPYINTVWISDFGLNLNVGARLNNHSEYGSHFIYNLNPSYTHKFGTNYFKILGSYSTSFIAPTLFQLFGDGGFVVPNLELEPEENTTIETGFELNLDKKITFSTVFFKRNEDNAKGFEIDHYINTNQDVEVNGFEIEIASSFINRVNISANYTFVEKKNVLALKIPKHKINANFNYDLDKKSTLSLSYQYVDDRLDTDFSSFPFINKNLKSFSLVDLSFQRELIKDRLKVNALISNIFNEEYTEVLGFTTKGRNVKLGINILF